MRHGDDARLKATARWGCVVALVAPMACSSSSGKFSPDVSASGTVLSSLAELRLVSADEGLAVGIVRGEESVRLLQWSVAGASGSALRAPSGCTSPVNVATGDANRDQREDILVFDSACGNWVALRQPDGGFEPVPWRDVLPELATSYYLYFEDWNSDGEPELVGASTFRLEGYSRAGSGWLPFSAELRGPSFSNAGVTDNVVIHGAVEGEQLVLFARAGEFSALSADVLDGGMTPLGERSQSDLELLKPYEAYDQLHSLDAHRCGGLAVGVGFFPSSPRFPRRLVWLDVIDSRSYSANAIATAHEDVISLATHRGVEGWFAGAISRRAAAYVFELFALRDCQWTRVAGPEELPFHPLCSGMPDGGESCAGERLVATGKRDHLTFLHFGGAWLDVVTASAAEGAWELDSDAWQL
jgi:hypothetical protein